MAELGTRMRAGLNDAVSVGPADHVDGPGSDSLPQALGRLRVSMDDAYARASRKLGLSAQQAELLCAAMEPSSVKDLAQVLRCDRSNVTRLVDRALARGDVQRRGEEEDGRVTVVELTPKGETLAVEFIRELEAQTQALRASWPTKREALAAAVLNEIATALDAGRESPRRRRRRAPSAS